MKNKTLENIRIGAVVTGLIGLLVFLPILTFGFAYLGGLILKWIVGQSIADGLNLVFETTRFTPNVIPITCATLATIGKYFKSTQTNNNK